MSTGFARDVAIAAAGALLALHRAPRDAPVPVAAAVEPHCQCACSWPGAPAGPLFSWGVIALFVSLSLLWFALGVLLGWGCCGSRTPPRRPEAKPGGKGHFYVAPALEQ